MTAMAPAPAPATATRTAARPSRPRTLSAFRSGPFTYGLLVIMSTIFMVPLIFVISIALSADTTVSSGQLTVLPRDWEFANFVKIFQTSLPVGSFLVNSVIISVTSAIAWILFVVIMAFTALAFATAGRWVFYESEVRS